MFEFSCFAAGDRASLKILHGDEGLLLRVEEFSKIRHDEIDIFSRLRLWTS